MSNEFEKQKQEIINAIREIDGIRRLPDCELFTGLCEIMQKIAVQLIDKLQPPAPPHCDTCKKFIEFESMECLVYSAVKNQFPGILFLKDTWGCSRHSDYDKDGEL